MLATEGQRKKLKNLGVLFCEDITVDEARELLQEVLDLDLHSTKRETAFENKTLGEYSVLLNSDWYD